MPISVAGGLRHSIPAMTRSAPAVVPPRQAGRALYRRPSPLVPSFPPKTRLHAQESPRPPPVMRGRRIKGRAYRAASPRGGGARPPPATRHSVIPAKTGTLEWPTFARAPPAWRSPPSFPHFRRERAADSIHLVIPPSPRHSRENGNPEWPIGHAPSVGGERGTRFPRRRGEGTPIPSSPPLPSFP